MNNGMLRIVIMPLPIDGNNERMMNIPLDYRSIQWTDTIIPEPEEYIDSHLDNIEEALEIYQDLLKEKNMHDIIFLN